MSARLFLRGIDGRALGPLGADAVGVLFGMRVIDERTPVSEDGASFAPIAERPRLLEQLAAARDAIVAGRLPPLGDPDADLEAALAGSLDDRPLVEILFEAARRRARGRLRVMTPRGTVGLGYADGKIVEVEVAIADLELPRHLLDTGAIDVEALARAEAALDASGGDLGAALIAAGAIAPHVYVERYAAWARAVLGALVAETAGATFFAREDVRPQGVPLGLDRYGAIVDALRSLGGRVLLERVAAGARTRTVIPRTQDGVTLEELKLPPKDLRVLRAIDGAKTLEALISMGDHAPTAVGVALALGWATLGDDPEAPKERAEAARLEDVYAQLAKAGQLEVLGVGPGASDEDVRARYMELAKQYHPDAIRQTALPELVAARAKLFALVQSAYSAADSAEKRQNLGRLKQMGYEGRVDEQAVVRSIIEAEIAFKKAEALVRMRRHVEALAEIASAVKKKPDEIEYRIHAAYYAYLAAPGGGPAAAQRALDELVPLVRKRADLPTAHVFVARLSKVLGQDEAAQKAFKRALDLDPRCHEAESEIRLANLRAQKQPAKKKWL